MSNATRFHVDGGGGLKRGSSYTLGTESTLPRSLVLLDALGFVSDMAGCYKLFNLRRFISSLCPKVVNGILTLVFQTKNFVSEGVG